MKLKYVALMLAAALAFGTIATSCTSEEETQQGVLTSREVDSGELDGIHKIQQYLSLRL